MHKYFKHIAVVLLITMLTTLLPLNAFADEIKKQSAANTPKLKFQENVDSKILGEVTEKRGKYVKQFRKKMVPLKLTYIMYQSITLKTDNGRILTIL